MSTPGGIYHVRKISEYLQSEFKDALQVVPVRALHHDDLIDKFHSLADAFLSSGSALEKASLIEAQNRADVDKYMSPLRSYEGWIKWINDETVTTLSTTSKNIVGAINEAASSGGVSDHGGLTGLSDDDHTQYILANGSRNLSGILSYASQPTFTGDNEIITKKYVDDNITGLYNTAIVNKEYNQPIVAGNNDFTFDTEFDDLAYLIIVECLDSSGNFQVYQIPDGNRTTTGFRLVATSTGILNYWAISISGGVTDISTVAWANITGKPTFSTVATSGDHTDLSNIGSNTHSQIDTHISDNSLHKYEAITIACSDETTDLTTGTGIVEFQMPFAMTVTEVLATVTTAPTGSNIQVDINEGGISILSTIISIDVSEKTSNTATTPPVISDSTLADNSVITIDLDQIGSTIAGTGLKVQLIGYRS